MMHGKNSTDRTVRTTGELDGLEFWENGLLPVVTQNAVTGEVLMMAFANREALERTLETGEMHYWSRSRQELWHKGATSGNRQRLVSLHRDCDSDALLARVHPLGPACHTGERSCFGSLDFVSPLPGDTGNDDGSGEEALSRSESTLPEIWALLRKREKDRPGGSYTVRLLEDENLRLKKLGEETVELVLALARHEEERIAEEGADLVYHLLVALLASGVELDDLLQEMEKRKR
jgi:phosphoribosyl-ATP pyrophosphohydrolase/phosphoribosyl-AMP cyclohydrolase